MLEQCGEGSGSWHPPGTEEKLTNVINTTYTAQKNQINCYKNKCYSKSSFPVFSHPTCPQIFVTGILQSTKYKCVVHIWCHSGVMLCLADTQRVVSMACVLFHLAEEWPEVLAKLGLFHLWACLCTNNTDNVNTALRIVFANLFWLWNNRL